MAGGMDLGTSGRGRRSLDAQLNLVPFIDLMAVTIVFLIMSAVWTQLGKLNVAQDNPHGPPIDTPTQAALVMTMSRSGLDLFLDGRPMGSFSLEALDKVRTTLVELKKDLPQQSAITLQSDDDVTYEHIVRLMVVCIGAELPSVTLNPRG